MPEPVHVHTGCQPFDETKPEGPKETSSREARFRGGTKSMQTEHNASTWMKANFAAMSAGQSNKTAVCSSMACIVATQASALSGWHCNDAGSGSGGGGTSSLPSGKRMPPASSAASLPSDAANAAAVGRQRCTASAAQSRERLLWLRLGFDFDSAAVSSCCACAAAAPPAPMMCWFKHVGLYPEAKRSRVYCIECMAHHCVYAL